MSFRDPKPAHDGTPATTISLRGVAGVLPPRRHTLEELEAAGKLVSSSAALADLGFEAAHLADAEHDLKWLAREAATRALADARLEAGEIDAVVWASALAHDHVLGPLPAVESIESAGDLLQSFRYPSGWLQDELGLDRASLVAVAQQGCVSMFTAISIARNMLVAEPKKRHVLCLGVDVLPPRAPREILYNLISDAACGVVVSREGEVDRWLGFHQVSKGYYWDTPAREKEILAAYFPTAKLTIDELLKEASLSPQEVDFVIPSGVQRASWPILLDLVDIPTDRLYEGATSFGHSIVADNFLLLEQLRRRRDVPPGTRLLLFTYGFGSSWCGLLLQH